MIGQHEVMVSQSPSSGPELLALLNSFSYLKTQLKDRFGVVTADYLHSLANVLQNLQDLQLKLGDNANADQQVKALQENMMDKKDNYVSLVTSLNTWFGSKVMTSSGILLNNA